MPKRVLRDNGLSITLFGLFFAILIGQSLTGLGATTKSSASIGSPR